MIPPNGRKRRTKEPPDEDKREECKAALKLNIQKNEDHGIRLHHFMANRWGNNGDSDRLYFLGVQKSLQMVTVAIRLKDTCSMEEKL